MKFYQLSSFLTLKNLDLTSDLLLFFLQRHCVQTTLSGITHKKQI
jgi:hypothetical protein